MTRWDSMLRKSCKKFLMCTDSFFKFSKSPNFTKHYNWNVQMSENNSSLNFCLFLKQWQDETVCYGNHVKSSQCAPTVRSFATTQSKVKLSVRDLGCATYQTTASPAWLAKNRPLFVKYRPEIGILLPKLFWPTVRKNCFSDREKLLKF